MTAAAADEPLFPLPDWRYQPPVPGERVNVRFSWGDEEGRLIRYVRESGFPMAKVGLSRDGHVVNVNVAQVSKLEP